MDGHERQLIKTRPLVICDFDGTLAKLQVDWTGLKQRLARLAKELDAPWTAGEPLDRCLYRVRDSGPSGAFLTLCGEVSRWELAGFHADLVNLELVHRLHQRGRAALGVCSANTLELLQTALLDPAFTGLNPHVIGKESVQAGKPSPEGLHKICKHFGATAAQAVYVGDADVDIAAGAAAGITTVDVRRSAS